jgi:hypothetical protein
MKEIKQVTESIIRVTTIDERWYAIPVTNAKTGLPEYKFLPSSTWIAEHYPKGVAFYKWLAQKGWDESESIKEAAGKRGSKVHKASEAYELGDEINFNLPSINPETGQLEPWETEEIEAIVSFAAWHKIVNPEVVSMEKTVIGDGYAGTLDRIYRIKDDVKVSKYLTIKKGLWLIDLKTSKNIWASHEIQISSYKHANFNLKELKVGTEEWESLKLGILQLGYQKNEQGFKFTEIEDKYPLFLAAKQIWENENPEAKPKQKDYPIKIQKGV